MHPAMYRSFTSPPPVPPKPSLLFEPEPGPAIPTSAYLGNSRATTANTPETAGTTSSGSPSVSTLPSRATTADQPTAGPSTGGQPQQGEDGGDGDDLAVAMALSRDESMREEERMQELVRLEEEEFERALAASMLTADRGYDFYETQPEAGPSNWASSVTQKSPSAAPPDVSPEPGPSTSSASSSSSSEASAKDAEAPSSQAPQSTEKSQSGDNVSQAPKEAQPADGTTRVPSPQSTRRYSLDTASPHSGTSPSNHEEALPIYSPQDTEQTPTASSLPPTVNQPEPAVPQTETPKEDNDGDYDGDELPYLRGTRESLSVSIPDSKPSTDVQGKSVLSPVSSSFIDLSYDDSYIDEDEAFARRLAEEEETAQGEEETTHQENGQSSQASAESHLSRNSSTASASTHPRPDTPSDLPTYNEVISVNSAPVSRKSTFLPEVRVDSPTTPVQNEKAELARNISLNSAASDPISGTSSQPDVPFSSAGPSAVTLPSDGPHRIIGRVSSMSALLPSRPPPEDDLPLTPVDDLATNKNHLSLKPRSGHLVATSNKGASNNDAPPGPTSAGVLNANHFVDSELLHGVSIQFTPPVISAKLVPMSGPMPTLISLPYGRCPPLHFQAPSWRHLLKLMARLSGTKMEPSIEAMAVAKNEAMKLRTVIQFIKPHHMSHEWRTILWFTIDHPVPPNIPNASKYSCTNVNNLPFSYTLSSVPAMLRDASDTVLSKTYTIPASASVPYPSLPITFPNLALYLQAALDDSRQQNESNPLRKLAKMVQTCYPNDLTPQGTEEPENSRGVSGLFKKVMGRGGKKGKRGGGNEDTYDLVTPFVPDEYLSR